MKVKNIKKNFKAKETEIGEKHIESSSDSHDSDNEEVLNKRGVIPREWFVDQEMQGYDLEAKKVTRELQEDKLEQFIQKKEDPNWWRTIRDELNEKDLVLTDQQLDLLDRIRHQRYATAQQDSHSFVEFDWDQGMFPLSAAPRSKKSFMPSQYERKMINKLVLGIRQGKITLAKDKEQNKDSDEELFDIWESTETGPQNSLARLQAPKVKLPGHQESYNPSKEYLWDEQEKQEWLDQDPDERLTNYIPKCYDNLRRVEGYDNLILERFERCMDLYLLPRLRKKKLDIDPDSLLPTLPKPEELRPFPTQITLEYTGHTSRVRTISVSPTGQYLASGDEVGQVIIWDVITGRQLRQLPIKNEICHQVQWSNKGLLAVVTDNLLEIYAFTLMSPLQQEQQKIVMEQSQLQHEKAVNIGQHGLDWIFPTNSECVLQISLPATIKQVDWHSKGDYLLTVSPTSEKKNEIVYVHSLSKGQSQRPFTKSKSNLEKAVFHPSKPLLVIMCRKGLYVYNLAKQQMVKKLLGGAQWNSSLHVHPRGDNLLVGSFDKKVMWFDLDLANTPYKTMKYHTKAIRQVKFHPHYPLFASCSDDCSVNIFHGNVYNDLMQNALIVPLKMLKGHKYTDEIGVLDIDFHPQQPWLFSCGADRNIILWT